MRGQPPRAAFDGALFATHVRRTVEHNEVEIQKCLARIVEMHFRHVVLAMSFMACGGGGAMAHATGGEPDWDLETARVDLDAPGSAHHEGDGPDVPYDRAVQKSIHNAYERFEPLLDQLVYHRVRSVELDLHVRREGAIAPSGDWFVYHEDNPVMRRSSCSQLSDCLGQLAAFHTAVPRHEVVTVFVDLKESFEAGHRPADLDAAFARALGRDNIVAPSDVMGACPHASSVRDAVTGTCAFPTLRELRGKFVVVTTGGTSCDRGSLVSRYAGDDASARLAFIGPNVDTTCPAESYDARPDAVFFNMSFDERARATHLRSKGLVTRIYRGGVPGGLATASEFQAARLSGATHLATDKTSFEQDGWSATHGARGFPFTCDGCGDDLAEPGSVLGMRATSGDQWGTSDSAFLAYEDDASDSSWGALVSVPSSHVAPFAKACLVARESDAADAANVSVCRTFDANPPRAQVRSRTGASTTSISAPTFDGLTAEAPAFLRLSVRAIGSSSTVTASVSRDGKTWLPLNTTTLPVPLPIRGVAVSSHTEAAKVKALFTNLARTKDGTTTSVSTAALRQKALGPGASGDAFDGVFPP